MFKHRKNYPSHCSKCPHEIKAGCPYVFKGGYVILTESDWKDPSAKNWDLCVYNDDKDVIDNQCAMIEYENGVRATFNLQLFAEESYRDIHITGEKGHLEGHFGSKQSIRVKITFSGEETLHSFTEGEAGHGGGDYSIFKSFTDAIRHKHQPMTDLRSGFESAVIAIKIDEAMRSSRVVEIDPAEYEM